MDFDDYQKKAKMTAIYPSETGLYYTALGLVGEAGEIANKVKKIIRDQEGKLLPQNIESLEKEIGDVLWYCAMLCYELNLDMNDVAEHNCKKLGDRHLRGTITGEGDER